MVVVVEAMGEDKGSLVPQVSSEAPVMGLEDGFRKASLIMAKYRMTEEDQMQVMQILTDGGVEHCLTEAEKFRERNEEMIARAVNSKEYIVRPN